MKWQHFPVCVGALLACACMPPANAWVKPHPSHLHLAPRSYREASDIIKKGKMSSLFINDLDAGAGRMGDATQVRGEHVGAELRRVCTAQRS